MASASSSTAEGRVFSRRAVLIWSSKRLLIWPISDFAELISLLGKLFGKFSLWSFKVKIASLCAKTSNLSATRAMWQSFVPQC